MANNLIKTQICSKMLIIAVDGYLNRARGEAIVRISSRPPYDGIGRVILLLEGVQAANSVGISYLLELVERLKAAQGRLALVRANPSLIKTFAIMGLYAHALKAESLTEAMRLLE